MTAYTTCLALSAYIIFEHYCLPQHHSTAILLTQHSVTRLLSVLSTRHKPQAQWQRLLLTQIRVSSWGFRAHQNFTIYDKISESYFLPVLHTKSTPAPGAQMPEQEASWPCTVAAIWKHCKLKTLQVPVLQSNLLHSSSGSSTLEIS